MPPTCPEPPRSPSISLGLHQSPCLPPRATPSTSPPSWSRHPVLPILRPVLTSHNAQCGQAILSYPSQPPHLCFWSGHFVEPPGAVGHQNRLRPVPEDLERDLLSWRHGRREQALNGRKPGGSCTSVQRDRRRGRLPNTARRLPSLQWLIPCWAADHGAGFWGRRGLSLLSQQDRGARPLRLRAGVRSDRPATALL